MARILLGVTGGIAAYKACELLRLLAKDGHDVVPLVTRGADRFVRRATFEALARRPQREDPYPHLDRADLLVVAPLTANTLAKLAHGLADDVLTEAALAHRGPILVAPAMNPRMWSHPATQANAALLRERGVELIGPDEGETAEGESGVGRMAEPEAIHARVRMLLAASSNPSDTLSQGMEGSMKGALRGKRVLVTAGGTREPLDPVRFLGNRSSGRMGVALAAEAARRGADVTLLASNLAVSPPIGLRVVETPTAADLERETRARADADVVLMAAAVADYRPVEAGAAKRPRSAGVWTLQLEPTEDVLAGLAARRTDGQVLVGFAADLGEDGLARAREKLRNKGVNLIVFNDVSRNDVGFESPDNEVVLVSKHEERRIDKAPKEQIAAWILDEVERLLERGSGEAGR